jgi:GNAT superfamily N-acetyltransferase
MSQPSLCPAEPSDLIRTRRGDAVSVRMAVPADAAGLQAYVGSLTPRSRYNRFLGAMSELPPAVLADFVHSGRGDRFTLVAVMADDADASIIAEARYALDTAAGTVEFGLSVQDRWQGHGIGPALLREVERRAAVLGAHSLFGETLRSNDVMIALARKAGYLLRPLPDDWRLARFEKPIAQPTALALPVMSGRPQGEPARLGVSGR